MNFKQFENYKFKNNRSKIQLKEYKNPIISVEDLKEITNTKTSLLAFRDLEKRVIKTALMK